MDEIERECRDNMCNATLSCRNNVTLSCRTHPWDTGTLSRHRQIKTGSVSEIHSYILQRHHMHRIPHSPLGGLQWGHLGGNFWYTGNSVLIRDQVLTRPFGVLRCRSMLMCCSSAPPPIVNFWNFLSSWQHSHRWWTSSRWHRGGRCSKRFVLVTAKLFGGFCRSEMTSGDTGDTSRVNNVV